MNVSTRMRTYFREHSSGGQRWSWGTDIHHTAPGLRSSDFHEEGEEKVLVKYIIQQIVTVLSATGGHG